MFHFLSARAVLLYHIELMNQLCLCKHITTQHPITLLQFLFYLRFILEQVIQEQGYVCFQ